MKVKFNFNLEAWIQDVEIEADSIEEAENKLYGMTVQELIEAGYVHTSDLDDVEGEIVEQDYKVKVYNIEFEPEDILEYGIAKDLPEKDTVLEFTFKDIKTDREYDELHGYIDDELFNMFRLFPTNFDFDIVEKTLRYTEFFLLLKEDKLWNQLLNGLEENKVSWFTLKT